MPAALVTGASRGIGRQTALALARAGWDVAFTGRTAVEGEGRASGAPVEGSLATTARLLEEVGVRALPIAMDLLDLSSVRAAAAAALAWGPVDLLVNNAIVQLGQPAVLDDDLDVVTRTVVGNYVHQLALIREVVPAMLARGGGTVVNMASGSATTDPPAGPGQGGWSIAYSASKAALMRVAGGLNAEHGSQGLRAFNVDPGFVVTESMRARGGAEALEAAGFTGGPMDATGKVVVWLASAPEASEWLGRTIYAPALAATLD